LTPPPLRLPRRPHTLGIDDGPFQKGQREPVVVVAVMMEGSDLVEAVACSEFAVDGANATEFLSSWIQGLRLHPALHAVLLGGITIAGLGVIDVPALAAALAQPVLIVNRRDPRQARLDRALAAARLDERIAIVARTPDSFEVDGLHLACAGIEPDDAARLLRATRGKSDLPEPLRVAHLIAAAVARGESRGRP
jgi:endonuclease V-like protein UPF0215 family